MPNIQAEIVGYHETRNLLRELPKRVERKGLRAAVTAGSSPIRRTMKAIAPRDQGILAKSIITKVKAYKGAAVSVTGARTDVSAQVRRALRKGDTKTATRISKAVPANYLHLVTHGTKPHMVGHWHHPGTKAQPFLAQAYQETKSQAEAAAAAKLKEVVESEARSLGKL